MNDGMEAGLTGWVGRSRSVHDEVSAALMRRMAATLDQEIDLAPGSPIPPHWIAILFDDAQPQSTLGPDGHPSKGEFLPPVPLPRRMLAGRRLSFHEPARIGDALERRSEIVSITPKTGRSGQLIFVGLRHTVTGPRGVVAVEEQDIAYREAAPEGGAKETKAEAPAEPEPAWDEAFSPDPVLLFRYSALCFNGHRIHYDADYARTEEGYPALVVNGGLTSLMLLEAARRQAGGRTPARYAVRTIRPLFVGRQFRLRGTAIDGEGKARAWAAGTDGAALLRIDLEYAP
ncbi:MaoC family dehydratase N-terminal domain-containing protein [Acetobacteraceae bacterium H6797]|nr:MaoC family dehydratase N-terminal domain-containing protein [Acetobacteraceae bacterium H6797]